LEKAERAVVQGEEAAVVCVVLHAVKKCIERALVFMSFCLGLASYSTAGIPRDLSDGVTESVSRAVGRVSQKLSLAVTKTDSGGK
jgi:hypothetical protein